MENQPTTDLWTAADAAVADAVRRLRRRSNAWWRDAIPAGGDRAGRIAALVAELVALDPTAAERGTPPPPERDETLVDQLRVVAYDLKAAAREGHDVPVEAVADAVARCLRDVDPRR